MSGDESELNLPAETQQARRKRRRRLLWTALILLLLAVAVRSRLDEQLRIALEDRIAAAVGGQVRIGQLDVNLWTLGADFREFELRIADDREEIVNVRIVSGRVRLSWLGLLRFAGGKVGLAEVRLNEPDVHLVRRPEGLGAARRKAGNIDLAIDRLQVRQGRFRLEDRVVPFEVGAVDVGVQAVWGGYRRTLVGRIGLDLELTHAPLEKPLRTRLDGRFRWLGNSVRLEEMSARGRGVSVGFDGDLDWSDGVKLAGAGRAELDLETLRGLFDPALPEAAGSVDLEFSVEPVDGELEVSGRVEGTRLRYGPLQVERISSPIRYRDGRLELQAIAGVAMSGSLVGNVDLSLGPDPVFRAELTGQDLDLGELLRTAGTTVPLVGEFEASASLAGDPRRPAGWVGDGRFVLEASTVAGEGLPTRGTGTVRFDRGVLHVDSAEAQIAASRLAFDLDLPLLAPGQPLTMSLRGDSLDVERLQLATLAVLASVDVPAPELLREPLSGVGTVNAEIELGAVPTIEVALALERGAWSGRSFDRVRADLRLDGRSLAIDELEVWEGTQSVRGSALIELGPFALRALELDASSIDPGWVFAGFGIPVPLDSRLEGQVELVTARTGLKGQGSLQLQGGDWFGEPIGQVAVDLAVDHDIVKVVRADWDGPTIDVRATGRLDLRSRQGTVHLSRGRVRLARLEWLRRAGVPLDGVLKASGTVRFGPDEIAGEAELSVTGLEAYGIALGNSFGELRLADDRVTGALTAAAEMGYRVQLDCSVVEDLQAQIAVTLEQTRLDLGVEAFQELELITSGQLRLEGPLARPAEVVIDGRLGPLALSLGARRFEAAGDAAIRWAASRLDVGPVKLTRQGLEWQGILGYDAEHRTLDANAVGDVDLGLLSLIFPGLRASGTASMELHASGPPEQPILQGSLKVPNGRLRALDLPVTLEQADLEVVFEEGSARITKLDGLLGTGELRGSGSIELAGLMPERLSIDLQVEGTRLEMPEDFEAYYRGDLRLRGTPAEPRLEGEIELLQGSYREDFDLAELLTARTREFDASTGEGGAQKLALDLRVFAEGDIWVRNNLAEVEARADLKVGGSIDRPELTGRISVLEGGTLEFQDVEYEIESASLDFVDIGRIDPYVSLGARTQVARYDIFLGVEGKLDAFEYTLTSSPTLSQQDIIAVLTTGRTLQDLTGGTGTGNFTGDLAANYFASALTGRFERQLERALGLERVQINPLLVEGQADPTTRITVGKEVHEDLMLVFSTEIGSEQFQIYQVEWRASRKYQVTLQQHSQFGVGGQIQYADRWWWKKPPRQSVPVAPLEEGERPSVAAGGPLIAAVRIEGVPDEVIAELRARIPLDEGEPFRRARMFSGVENLRKYYVDRDRLGATVRATSNPGANPGEVEVTYRVSPGPVIRVELDGATRKEVRRLNRRLEDLWLKSLFVDDIYRDTVRTVEEFYHDRGFFAADVSASRGEDEVGQVLTITIDRGKPVTVESIEIQGAVNIPEERIRKQMLTRPPSLFSKNELRMDVLQDDLHAIRNLGRDMGYLSIRADPPRIRLSPSGNSARITIVLHEGPQYSISSLEFSDDLPFTQEQLRGWTGLKVGEIFSPSRLLEAESSLRVQMDSLGYPNARATAEATLDGQQVSLFFDTDAGQQLVLSEITIDGNFWTHDKVIRRELEIEPGQPISRDEMLRTQHRLYKLGIFRNVRIGLSPVEEGSSEQRLTVDVEESKPIRFLYGIGYDTEEKFKTTLTLRHDNLGGRNRRLGFSTSLSSIRLLGQINFEERRLFGEKLPTLVSLTGEQLEFDGFTVRRISAAFRVDHQLSASWKSFLRYDFQRVRLVDLEDELIPEAEGFQTVRLGDVGLNAAYSNRDSIFLTTKGTSLLLQTRFFNKIFGSEKTFVKPTAAWARFFPLGGPGVYATSARMGFAIPYGDTEIIPVSERFFAGGSNTIRGFQLNEVGPEEDGRPIGGEAELILNQEYRPPIWKQLKGLLFLDAGNVYRRVSDFDPTDLRWTIGAGLRLETAIGPLRLEYGAKLDRMPGETKGEWYIAIGEPF